MVHKIKVTRYVRRRPVSEKMRELFEKMGVKPEVSVEAHERVHTPRRRPRPKKDEDEDPEEEE